MADLLYTVPEASKLLKTNTNYVYELVNCGLLPCLKLGRIKIRAKALEEFLVKYEGMDITDPKNIKTMEEV